MTIIEQIKNKLDIVEEISLVVPLKKSGKAYKGLCPFHGERTPSFYVFADKASWHCFGCHEGGDIFTFVEKQQGLDFKEALALLAEKAGIPLESYREVLPGGDEEDGEESARKRLRQINEAAAIWFHHLLLTSPEASYARAYLDGRGVSHDSITLFRLGFAPMAGDLLCKYLLSQEYTKEEIIAAGLGREREPGKGTGARATNGSESADARRPQAPVAAGAGLYDYFRNRVIFPIRDGRGRAIAFGGRELGGGSPKYLNTPQTPLFDKSATLYGLDLAREAIRRRDQVIIVEGYMDALIAHQYGEKNVVACIGSAITEKHVRQLKKLTKRLALALDPDTAGETATLRGIEIAQQGFDRVAVPVPTAAPGSLRDRRGEPRGMVRFEEQVDAEITVLRLPPGEDPDEVIRGDVEVWRRALAEALPLVDFLFEAHTANLRLDTPQGKTEAAKRLLPALLEVRDRVKQDAYVRRLAARLRTDERALQQELARLRREQLRNGQSTAETGKKSYMNERGGEQAETEKDEQARRQDAFKPSARADPALALEEHCLGLLFVHPTLASEICVIIDAADFSRIETRVLYQTFVTALQSGGSPNTQRMLSALPDPIQAFAEHLRQRVEAEPPKEIAALKRDATQAAYRLKKARLTESMTELHYLSLEAEHVGDQEELRLLRQRMQDVSLQQRTINSAVSLHG